MFDTETETWSEAGGMKVPRGRPGVSVVYLEEVEKYATDCVTKEISIESKYLCVFLAPSGAQEMQMFVCLSVCLSVCSMKVCLQHAIFIF